MREERDPPSSENVAYLVVVEVLLVFVCYEVDVSDVGPRIRYLYETVENDDTGILAISKLPQTQNNYISSISSISSGAIKPQDEQRWPLRTASELLFDWLMGCTILNNRNESLSRTFSVSTQLSESVTRFAKAPVFRLHVGVVVQRIDIDDREHHQHQPKN